jgi:hypothetical protein
MNVERQAENLALGGALGLGASGDTGTPLSGLASGPFGPFGVAGLLVRGDKVSTLGPAPFAGSPPQQPDGWNAILSQLANLMNEIMSKIGGAFGGPAHSTGDTFYDNASAGSTGDPHLAFNGTAGTGASKATRFDSMQGHRDLLDSDSFAGGFQISTQVTQPDAHGVTYNRRASISTDGGATRVSLDKNGNATIEQYGATTALADGQTIDLSNGESATRAQNGTVTVSETNAEGGRIATTLSENGHGVDVNVQAHDVDLNGDLLQQPQTVVQAPWRHTMVGPSTGPQDDRPPASP